MNERLKSIITRRRMFFYSLALFIPLLAAGAYANNVTGAMLVYFAADTLLERAIL